MGSPGLWTTRVSPLSSPECSAAELIAKQTFKVRLHGVDVMLTGCALACYIAHT